VTVKALGLTVPPPLLAKAELIEQGCCLLQRDVT
jgi:hypothetical protein